MSDSNTISRFIESWARRLAKQQIEHLPDDAEFVLAQPNDGRLWVDVLSEQAANLDEDGDPVIEQYILVPISELQRRAPDFFKWLTEKERDG